MVIRLTLGMGVCVLHDLGELLVHPLHQRQDATTDAERLLDNEKKNPQQIRNSPHRTVRVNATGNDAVTYEALNLLERSPGKSAYVSFNE